MQVEKFNVSKPREVTMRDNSVKTFWDNVGTVSIFTKDDGSRSGLVELHTFDQDIRLNMFPFKAREAAAPRQNNNSSAPRVEEDWSEPTGTGEDIDVSSIPF